MTVRVEHGDCRDVVKTFADASIAAIVTDPPYSLQTINKRFAKVGRNDKTWSSSGPHQRTARGFMNQKWDTGETAFDPTWWEEVLRVLRPGGHLIAFGGTRTYHRLACAIEDAGFEIRDQIGWLYGSGFPKSHDVSKGIDRRKDWKALSALQHKVRASRLLIGISQSEAARRCGLIGPDETLGGGGFMWFETGMRLPTREQYPRLKASLALDDECDAAFEAAEREVIGQHGDGSTAGGFGDHRFTFNSRDITAPATDSARQWQGWGTALKPAFEPLVIAQKPYTPQQLLAILVPTIGELICKVVSSEKTATFSLGLLRTNGFWSIATSLNNYLAALSGQESRVTTETASGLTTDLRILKSSLSRITRAIITGDASRTSGDESDALLAVSISRSVLAKCERLTNTTAGVIAIDWLAEEGSAPAGGYIQPNWTPIVLARKPLIGTVAANVQAHGTGAINIDGCRIEAPDADASAVQNCRTEQDGHTVTLNIPGHSQPTYNNKGRWPANIIHDGSEEVIAAFPETAAAKVGNRGLDVGIQGGKFAAGERGPWIDKIAGHDDSGGSAARFFYTAKADAGDRLQSKHPTVKPVDLMAYLCRLVTPPGGTVLDPFGGSGTCAMACIREGFDCIIIERELEYYNDILARLAHVKGEDTPLFSGAST